MRPVVKLVLATAAAIGAATAAGEPANAQRLDPLTKIATDDPFAHCTADHSGLQGGFLNPRTQVEPWVAVDPGKPGHLLVGVQQDRFAFGARGERFATSSAPA